MAYAYDAFGAGNAVQEPIEEPFYAYDASSAGDAIQEPIEEPIYAYDASGASDDVQEPIEEPAHAYDASGEGDYGQEPIEEPAYAYDASSAGDYGQEPIEEPAHAYDASGALDYVQEPIEEPAHAYDVSGAGDYFQESIEEPAHAFDASGAGDYVKGYFVEPMSGNTGEAHTFGINDGYSNDAWVNLVQGAKDITMNDGPEAVAVQQLDSAHDEEEEEEEEERSNPGGYHDRFLRAMTTRPTSRKPTLRPTTQKPSTRRPTTLNPTVLTYMSTTSVPTSSASTTSPINGNYTTIPLTEQRTFNGQMTNWKEGQGSIFSEDCDFPNQGDYKRIRNIRSDQCDGACNADSSCSHFTWYASTCYLKKGGAKISNARLSYDGTFCGIKSVINWKHGAAALWNSDCDFPYMGDYKQVYNQKGEQCDPLCASDSRCTHFAWNRGTCFLKERGAFKEDAKKLPGSGIICGIKKQYYKPRQIRQNWMSDMPDRTQLSDLLIPGTHDSAAGPQSANGWSQCHDWKINDQLGNGVRYFDLRLSNCKDGIDQHLGGDALCLWHGPDFLDLSLDYVAWDMYNFLRAHPREVIFVKLTANKGEFHTVGGDAEFRRKVEKYFTGHHEWWYHSGVSAASVTMSHYLSGARGLIIPFWDCGGCGGSNYGMMWGGSLPGTNQPRVDHDSQWEFDDEHEAFGRFKSRAYRANRTPGWFENKSAYTDTDLFGIPFTVRMVAEDMNPLVPNNLHGVGGYGETINKGIVTMDYPTFDMIEKIIEITRRRQFEKTINHNYYGI